MIPTLYVGQFYSVPWRSLKHIWQPRELSPIERDQHFRMVMHFRFEELRQLDQRNPFE